MAIVLCAFLGNVPELYYVFNTCLCDLHWCQGFLFCVVVDNYFKEQHGKHRGSNAWVIYEEKFKPWTLLLLKLCHSPRQFDQWGYYGQLLIPRILVEVKVQADTLELHWKSFFFGGGGVDWIAIFKTCCLLQTFLTGSVSVMALLWSRDRRLPEQFLVVLGAANKTVQKIIAAAVVVDWPVLKENTSLIYLCVDGLEVNFTG